MSAFLPGAGIGPVSLISRSPDKLDAFAVGLDGGAYTVAWQPGDTKWNGVTVRPWQFGAKPAHVHVL